MLKKIKHIMKEHVGKQNAITSSEIADKLGIVEDDTHAITRDLLLQAAEKYDLPLAAHTKGYFLIDNDEEYEEYIEFLNRRIEGINKRMSIITRNYKGEKNDY